MKKQNKTLSKNLDALKRVNPAIHGWLSKQSNVDWIQEIRSKSGAKNLLIKSGSNLVPAYTMKDPAKAAIQTAKTMALHKENISVIIGMGLGYLAKAILNKMEKGHRVLVVEPVGHMIRMAFGNLDFTDAINNGELLIITPGADEVVFALQFMSQQFVVSDWLVTMNKYASLRADEYGDLTNLVADTINQIMCNTGTVAGAAGGIIADNDIACLPYVIRHRGVAELKDMYKDKPAIMISTGPSLTKNIHHLIGLEDRVVIIAVGQALRVLLAYDIKPDFICTVDFGSVNFCHFKGLMDSDVPLVTINRSYAPLLKAWQGPKFIVATPVPGFEKMAAGILSGKGYVEAGGSVAHLVFGLAKHLGCNPLTFVGQDLALGETSHTPLADAAGEIKVDESGGIRWKVKDPRCHLSEGEQVHSMGPAAYVDGYYGGQVLTNMGLTSFLTSFEGLIKAYIGKDE